MPAKQKPKLKKEKQDKKRKEISPLFGDTCTNNKTGSTSSPVSTNNDNGKQQKQQQQQVSNQNKRKKQNEHFSFDTPNIQRMMNADLNSSGSMNTNTPINQNMNLSQQHVEMAPVYTYGVQQNGQQNGQHMGHQNQHQQIPPYNQMFHQPPPWAMVLIEDIKSIKARMEKIDNIEKAVNTINQKLCDLDTKVKSIDSRVTEVEKSASFINEKYEKQSKDIKTAQKKVENLQKSCENLDQSMSQIAEDQKNMKDKVLDAEFRSMRDNLIFYGIAETVNESTPEPDTKYINTCDKLVKQFISETLQTDADDIIFDRAHRLGKPKTNMSKPRPIIVKFHYHTQREKIRQVANNMKDQLKTLKCGVGIQIPKEWRDARKSLSDVFQEEKDKGHSVKFIGEKLLINGKEYKPTA